jgi:hypothetical protein
MDLILSGGTQDASPLESQGMNKAASVSHVLMERFFRLKGLTELKQVKAA